MATVQEPTARTRFPLLRAWWIADRGGVIRVAGLVLALVSFAFLWPSLIERGGAGIVLGNMVVHIYVVAWVMLASTAVRSIGTREVVTAYLLGTFLVPVLVFVPLTPIINWLGADSETLGVLFVPPIEEGAILAGTALIAWRLCRRAGRRPGVTDMLLVGLSVGSGLAIHEDALYGRFLASLYERTVSGAFDGPLGWLFPTLTPGLLDGGTGGGMYHSGKGALFGLTLGLVVVLYRRWTWIVLAIPGMWLYSTFDHSLYNYQVWNGLSPLRVLTGNGHVLTAIMVLGIPAAIAFDLWRRRRADLGLPAFGLRGIREAIRRAAGPLDTLVRLLAYGHYHRARNAALTAAWSNPKALAPSVTGVEAWGRLAFAAKKPTANAGD